MRHYFIFSTLLFSAYCSTPSLADSAVPVMPTVSAPSAPPINEASVAVIDQSPAALQLGLQAAFSEVMVKMSGNANIMSVPAVQNVSSNLARWVQSYSYVQQSAVTPPAKPSWMLDVVFNQAGLEQLLQVITHPPQQQDNTPQPSANGEIKLLVTGVKNMNDYATLMQTLREENGVTAVSVVNIDADRIALNMQVTENVTQLNAQLSSNRHFKPLMASADKNNNAGTLYYLWIGDQA